MAFFSKLAMVALLIGYSTLSQARQHDRGICVSNCLFDAEQGSSWCDGWGCDIVAKECKKSLDQCLLNCGLNQTVKLEHPSPRAMASGGSSVACISKEVKQDCFGMSATIQVDRANKKFSLQEHVSSVFCPRWPPPFSERLGTIQIAWGDILVFEENTGQYIGTLARTRISDGMFSGKIAGYEFEDCRLP